MLLVRAHRIPRDRLGRPRALEGLALVLRVGAYRCLAAGLFLLWLGFYLVTLPATYTGGTVGWVALPYLTPPLAAFAVVLALLLSLVTTVTVYSVRTALRQRAVGVGVGAVAASLLPASLCCTPLVPAVLAALGASTPEIYRLTGRIQGAVARSEILVLAGSALLLLVALHLGAGGLVGSCRRREGGECDERCC